MNKGTENQGFGLFVCLRIEKLGNKNNNNNDEYLIGLKVFTYEHIWNHQAFVRSRLFQDN